MLGCKFSLTKFLVLIDYLRKPQKLHTAKIYAYTVYCPAKAFDPPTQSVIYVYTINVYVYVRMYKHVYACMYIIIIMLACTYAL